MKTLDRRHWAFTVTFMVAYAILTATDAASTVLAIGSGLAQEANPHVGGGPGAFDLGRFLWINGAVLLLLTGMLVWSLGSCHRIDPRYLDRPRLAFWNWVYLNPFSARTVPRSAFHCIANPICILGLKGLATVHNLLIAKGDLPAVVDWKGVRAKLRAFMDTAPFRLDLDATPFKSQMLAETKTWKQSYGKALNGKARTDMEAIHAFCGDVGKRLAREVKDLEDVRNVMGALKEHPNAGQLDFAVVSRLLQSKLA
jgi:hypothetical protein